MFLMDLAEMERLKDILFHASAQSGEAFYILKTLREEMLSDTDLSFYDMAGSIDDNMASAIKSLLQVKETLYDLGCIVSSTAEQCERSEQSKTSIITGENL